MKKSELKKIQKDMEIVRESMAIFRDSARLGAVQELIVNLRTGKTTINIKNLKGGIHL